ncbi:MAG: hypothetical protein ACLGIN_10330 [Candidatus Sericytochromatia bacterium]
MSEATSGISKAEAIFEIERQIAEGRALMSLPLRSYDELVAANGRRSGWALRNRKLFYALFSESSMLARQSQVVALEEDASTQPGLASEVAAFRQAVLDQLACMAKVVGFLRKLASDSDHEMRKS